MRYKGFVCAVFVFILSIFILPQNIHASFPHDVEAICQDSTYFKDRGFDNASAILASAKDITSDSFVLVFYSRYNNQSKELLPQIQQWAESNHILVYGIDQYNKYTRDFGYFNTKTAFEGWEEYLDKQSFSFPAVFVYNSDTRILTARDNVSTLNTFYNILNNSGMLDEAYHDYAMAGLSSLQLNQLGLLLGTGNGLDLLRSPTRIEALTMYIRLLGYEEEALLCRLDHPFTDVPAWASPYVGFAYQSGMAEGISDSLFGSNQPITSAEFLTFVLRSLGYSSNNGKDFEWDSPYALAHSKGILPPGVNTNEFLRADMAIICRFALNASVKSSTNITLAQMSVSMGILDKDKVNSVLGTNINIPSVREELQRDAQTAEIMIDRRSPAYVIQAIKAALYNHPDTIWFYVREGSEADWVLHLMNNLDLPKEIVKDYDLRMANGVISIVPEYTVAAGAFAALTLNGYQASTNENMVVRFIKNNIGQIQSMGAETFCETYFEDVEIVADNELIYDDADAALLIKHCTSSAISKAQWLIYEIWQYPNRIK